MLTNSGINIVDRWFSIPDDLIGTPDYYNICNNVSNGGNGVVGVPINFWGNQMPFQGDAYVGFAIDQNFFSPIGVSEYLQCKLDQPLIHCKTYILSFYISLAEASAFTFSQLGAAFTNDTLKANGGNLVLHPPSVTSAIGFISDSIGWTHVSCEYVAIGGEQFLTIGYFGNNMQNDTMFIRPNQSSWPLPYGGYYLDSVSVVESKNCQFLITDNFPNVFTPNGDDINDVISFIGLGLSELECGFYNRWGQLVGKITSPNMEWDGRTMAGVECPEGYYYYVFNAKDENGANYSKTGFIELLR